MPRMCSICKTILIGFGIEHEESNCPLRTSRYCSFCASYGHLTKSCPAKPSKMFREPIFIEQLIPSSLLQEYKITSKTLIKPLPLNEPQNLLEIQDDDKAIMEYLKSQSLKISKKSKDNRLTLEEYAKKQNRRLVYLTHK
jgi:hypothetical protein